MGVIAFKHNRRGEPVLPKRLMQPEAVGRLLFLPLCPSTNARQIPVVRGGRPMLIPTPAADAYLATVGIWLKAWRARTGFQPIDTYRHIDCWFLLPRTNCDNHNYFKVVFDALEDAGIVTDDRYLLPRVQGVFHDAKNPQMIVAL